MGLEEWLVVVLAVCLSLPLVVLAAVVFVGIRTDLGKGQQGEYTAKMAKPKMMGSNGKKKRKINREVVPVLHSSIKRGL